MSNSRYITDIPDIAIIDTQAQHLDASHYVGIYQFDSGDQISVTAIEGQLYWRGTDSPEIALHRIFNSEFAPDLHIIFNLSPQEIAESLTLIQRGKQEQTAQRVSD
ncbi:MAG: hypothetical protein EA368_10040 [Leptolyngbya sp. DLM2.Bin27]|nr:MAG: hypothetical protein EA368_10040 [Leptolyngbya sp. DLM2.Bin27]